MGWKENERKWREESDRIVQDANYAKQYDAIHLGIGNDDPDVTSEDSYNPKTRGFLKGIILKRKNGKKDISNLEKQVDEKNTRQWSDEGYK